MVDILLASYNGDKYIREQIQSIINQTNKEWQLIIHDDCSSDDTVAVVEKIADDFNSLMRGLNDPRHIYCTVNSVPCHGAAANFFGLLNDLSSDYVMFCDQDDVWKPDKIDKTLYLMKKMEKKYGSSVPMLVYTDLTVADEKLNIIAPSFIEYMKVPPEIQLPRLLMQNSVTGCTVLMNRALYELLYLVKDVEKTVMHDHFAALVAQTLGKIFFLPEATMLYRQHGDNSVGASDARSLSYMWRRYKRGKKQFRQDMYNCMVQAGYFYELYGQKIKNAKIRNIICDFSVLYKKNKISRLKFYINNHVIKYGHIRAIVQLMWG